MAENNAVEAESTEEEQPPTLPDSEMGNKQPVVTETDIADIMELEDDAAGGAAEPEQKKRLNHPLSPAARKVVSWFAACGRCSFFLSGYRLICEEAAWETAVSQRKKNWLVLPWSHAAARLVNKTYGSRIDIDCYHFEGQCPECRRRFVFQAGEEETEAATFRIELKP